MVYTHKYLVALVSWVPSGMGYSTILLHWVWLVHSFVPDTDKQRNYPSFRVGCMHFSLLRTCLLPRPAIHSAGQSGLSRTEWFVLFHPIEVKDEGEASFRYQKMGSPWLFVGLLDYTAFSDPVNCSHLTGWPSTTWALISHSIYSSIKLAVLLLLQPPAGLSTLSNLFLLQIINVT